MLKESLHKLSIHDMASLPPILITFGVSEKDYSIQNGKYLYILL